MMLLDGLAPVTNEVGFFRGRLDDVVSAYMEWKPNLRPGGEGWDFEVCEQVGSAAVRDLICAYMPELVAPLPTREVFIPSRDETVVFYIDNFVNGTDSGSVCRYLGKVLGVESGSLILSADRPSVPEYGATALRLHDTLGEGSGRSINAVNDGGRWVFETSGEPLWFEDESRYRARRVRDRFDEAMLRKYCQHLGLPAFEPEALDVPNATVVRIHDHNVAPLRVEPVLGCHEMLPDGGKDPAR